MRHIKVDEQDLRAIQSTIDTITVRGVDDCGKIAGIFNLIEKVLREGGMALGGIHTESES